SPSSARSTLCQYDAADHERGEQDELTTQHDAAQIESGLPYHAAIPRDERANRSRRDAKASATAVLRFVVPQSATAAHRRGRDDSVVTLVVGSGIAALGREAFGEVRKGL